MFSCSIIFGSLWPMDWMWPTPNVAQAPPSMEFSRQEYWSESPFPTPMDLPNSGVKPESPALASRFFHHWATWESPSWICIKFYVNGIKLYMVFFLVFHLEFYHVTTFTKNVWALSCTFGFIISMQHRWHRWLKI